MTKRSGKHRREATGDANLGERAAGAAPEAAGIRLDKWLWAARFFKTRGLAAEAVGAGRVELNGKPTKASKSPRVGDTVTITRRMFKWTVVINELLDRRQSAKHAAKLYTETEESIAERDRVAAELRASEPPRFTLGGRPSKRDRRRMEKFERGE